MISIFRKIIALLFPRRCPVCGEWTESDTPSLCPQCAQKLADEYSRPCPCCKETAIRCTCKMEALSEHGAPVITMGFYEPSRPDSVSSRLIYTLKNSPDDSAAHILARDMAGAILKEFLTTGEDIRTWVITYAPRSLSGYEKNGFDQSRRLAGLCARYCGTRYQRLFRRHGGDTQKELTTKDRRANAVASLRLRHPRRAYTGKYIVIDDILTTGATCQTCASLLRARGAKAVRIATPLKTLSRPSEQKPWYASLGNNSQ